MKEQKMLIVKTVFQDYNNLQIEKSESIVHEPKEVNAYLENGFVVKNVIVDKDSNDKWPLLFIILEKEHEKEQEIKYDGPLPFYMGDSE